MTTTPTRSSNLSRLSALYLRTIRQQRGLTQRQLERLSDVAQNTISKLETHATARPVFGTVVALADALNVNPKQLRFGPDPAARRERQARDVRRQMLHSARNSREVADGENDVQRPAAHRKTAVSRRAAPAAR